MSPQVSRHGSPQPKKRSPSSSPKRSKSNLKDADWSDVTDPEERRRIQNRIAQRKFREKAKENKENSERESRNQEHAGNSYRIPIGTDFTVEPELSGLPWGSVNLSHVVSRGHKEESRRSSGHGTYVGDDSHPASNYYTTYGSGLHHPASYSSSSSEDYHEMTYIYDPALTMAPSQIYPGV